MRLGALIVCAVLLRAAAQENRVVSGPLVTSDRWPQATDLASWTRDVMRIEGVEMGPETAQGKAFFEWLRLFCRMAVGGMIQAYEGPHGKERYVLDAHKNLFVYGWGYCDTCSRIADAAWDEYKSDARAGERVVVQNADGGYHTMYRLRLDGRHGAFDPRYGYYLVERDAADARVLDWAEVGDDANLLRNREFKHRSRPFFEVFGREWDRALALKPVYFQDEKKWREAEAPQESVFGNSQYQPGTQFHDMNFRLPKGVVIERFWDNSARRFYVPAGEHTRREWPFLPSGRFYRVTEKSLDGNWPKYDPNYLRSIAYLQLVPPGEGYGADLEGGRTIGQAWGRIRYEPHLDMPDFPDALQAGSTLVHALARPYLRPRSVTGGGQASFEFYSPYVLVDGTLTGELAGDGVSIEIRTETAKPVRASDPGEWSEWQTLATGGQRFEAPLGRPRLNGADAGIHGVYRFQVRVTVPPRADRAQAAGLNAIRLDLSFENGIMSIPRIFAGRNIVRFRVKDASLLRGPVQIVYRYETQTAAKVHTRLLEPEDFRLNTAAYVLDAPGLVRCKSLSIAY